MSTLLDVFKTMEYGPAPESSSAVRAWLEEHNRKFGLFINNRWVAPKDGAYFDTTDPATGEKLASYAGTVPRLHESGGRSWHGQVRTDVNHYVKWALVEAVNIIVLNQESWHDKHVVVRYQRLRKHKGHAKAVVAVARHLAESIYWVLKKDEDYREPRR